MEQYLEPATDDAYIFRFDKSGKYVCKDLVGLRVELANRLIASDDSCDGYFVDLTRMPLHSLIFDIDVNDVSGDTTGPLHRYFYSKFLKVLEEYLPMPAFDYILALRNSKLGGMHVHLPELAIAHDDYVHLCELMKPRCDTEEFTLDCPSSLCLVASAKGGSWKDDVYVPQSGLSDATLSRTEAARLMMPIPCRTCTVVYFPTEIVPREGHFQSFVNGRHYSILKEDRLEKTKKKRSFLYRFFKKHSDSIRLYSSPSRVVKTWYKRFSSPSDDGLFGNVNTKIRKHCIHLRGERDPLRSILRRGEFVVPVFGALLYELRRKNLVQVVEAFGEMCDEEILIPPIRLTFDTILHCAFRTYPEKTKDGIFFEYIGEGWGWIFQATTSIREMQNNIQAVQEKHFPIVRNSGHLYAWNVIEDMWMKVNSVRKIIQEIYYTHVRYFKGFSRLPMGLRNALEHDEDWIDELVTNTLAKVKTVESNRGPNTYKEMSKLYGHNVPEYYFLELDVVGQDVAD